MKMTRIFIEEMLAAGGGGKTCSHCKAPAEKSLCNFHLAYCRLRWRAWARGRAAEGLCCHCNRPGTRLSDGRRCVYCFEHRRLNNKRSRAWSRKNGKTVRESRKEAGLCIGCDGSHGPPVKPHVYCEWCRARHKVWRAKKKALQLSQRA